MGDFSFSEIDETAIDVAALQQAELMRQYCEEESHYKLLADKAEESLNLVKANLDKNIRANPKKYDIEKVTEPVVANAIVRSKKYQKAYSTLLRARYEHNCAKGNVKALEQRKGMIEVLTKLLGQSYFASPSTPRNIQSEMRKRRKSVSRTANSSIKISKKKKNG